MACFHTTKFSAKGNKNDNNKISLKEWLKGAFVGPVQKKMVDKPNWTPQYPRFTERAMGSLVEYALQDGYRYSDDEKKLMLDLHPL